MTRDITKGMAVRVTALAGMGLVGLGAVGIANAACMDGLIQKTLKDKGYGDVKLTSVVYRPGAGDDATSPFMQVSDVDSADKGTAIVGLWEFKEDGGLPDYGTQAWHSDGTEIMFSGAQNPATGDVCQGVWRHLGTSYTLNHIAMGWSAPGTQLGIRVHIHASVHVAPSGKTYDGKYFADVYSVSPQNPFDESVKIAHGSGNISGVRVNPD